MFKIKEEDYPLIMAEVNDKAREIGKDNMIIDKVKAVTQYLVEFWCNKAYEVGFKDGYMAVMKNI